MASELFVDNITGKTGTSGSAPITLSGDTATLGSSVTVPASVGSSMVLIKTITTSNGDTEILLQNNSNGVTIDSTYTNYMLVLEGVVVTTDGKHVYMQVGNSAGYDNACRGGFSYWYDNGTAQGTSGNNTSRSYYWNSGLNALHNNTSDGGLAGTFMLYNVSDAVYATHCTFQLVYYGTNGYNYGLSGSTTTVNQYAVDRIKFTTNSDSFQAGAKVSLYGIKDA